MSENKTEAKETKPVLKDKTKKDIVPIEVKRKKRRKRRVKNILFLFIWIYFLVNVFITDIDLILVKNNTSIDIKIYILLRFLIITLILVLTWIKIGNKRFWKNLGLFFLFPIYPALWILIKQFVYRIPKFLIERKSLILLYYYIESIIRFFVDFKFVLLRAFLFILGFILMFKSSSWWLTIPIGIFCFLQIYHLFRRFKQTFSPIKVFRINIDDLEEATQKPLSPENLDKIISDSHDKKDSSPEEKKMKEMESFLLISEFAQVFNFKLKEIISRRVYMLSFLGKALFSFFIAMVYFGGINYCIYKMNSGHFNMSFIPKYFDFFYYSFFTVIPDGTDIIPISITAKIVRMAGVSVGVLINLLLLTVYLTISNEKFKENLERMSNFTDNYSKGINLYFEKKYGHNPTDSLKLLRSFGSGIESTLNMIKKLIKKK